jgi:hypothetical protein
MLCNMSPLLRLSLLDFLVSQPLFAVLLHMALVATIMAFDGLLILGDILTSALSCLLGSFAFAL